MADNQGHIKPTADLIRQYLAGTLDDKTMHALEKQALDDPFLAEALEGYALHEPDQQAALNDLQARLEHRVAVRTRVRRLDYRWLAAAAVLLFMSITALFIINRPLRNDIAQVKELQQADTAAAVPAPAAADEAAPAPPAETTAVAPQQAAAPHAETANVRPALKSRMKEKAAAEAKDIDAKEKAFAAEAQSRREQQARAVASAAMKAVPAAAPPKPEESLAALSKTYTEKIDTIRIGRYATDTTTYARQAPGRVEGKISGAPNKYPNYHSEYDERLISGVVTDAATGQRLSGVVVVETGSSKAAVTDVAGNFTVRVKPGSKVNLDVSMIGYEKKNVAIGMHADSQLNIKLPANNLALNEKVIVGYGEDRMYGGAGKKKDQVYVRGTNSNSIMLRGKRDTSAPRFTLSGTYPGTAFSAPRPSVTTAEYSRYLESRRKLVIPGLLENKNGQVRLSFTVTPKGELKDFKVLESMGDMANKAAISIVKEGPRWLPAANGKDAVTEVVVPLILLKQE